MNNNGTNNTNRDTLGAKIKALAFAKTETELFLDTHPDSRQALSYYKEIVEELNDLCEEYTAKYGPLTAAESAGDTWSWISGPWPWQRDVGENKKGGM